MQEKQENASFPLFASFKIKSYFTNTFQRGPLRVLFCFVFCDVHILAVPEYITTIIFIERFYHLQVGSCLFFYI